MKIQYTVFMIDSSHYVKGNYRKYLANKTGEYLCFVPPTINKEFILSNKIAKLNEEAIRLVGELNAYSHIVPNVDFYISMHVKKEALQSSRIEGTHTDIDDVVLEEEDVSPERRDDWREVQNYIKALNHSIQLLDQLPLTMRLLNEAHSILLAGTRGDGKTPGRIRTSQNWIGGSSINSALYVPPHSEHLGGLLSDLEVFIHNESLSLPKLIKIAITHYQFETIHPYADGNGRIGRLLIALQLINYGLLTKPTLYMSDFFERNRTSYYDALTEVRAHQNLDHWLIFFLEGVIESAKSSKEKFEKIMELREQYDNKILSLGRRAENASKLIRVMYESPVISIPLASRILSLSQSNSGLLVTKLADKEIGILKEITGFSRNRLFILDEYVRIFRS